MSLRVAALFTGPAYIYSVRLVDLPPFWMLAEELRTMDVKRAATLTKQLIPCVAVWGYEWLQIRKGSVVGH